MHLFIIQMIYWFFFVFFAAAAAAATPRSLSLSPSIHFFYYYDWSWPGSAVFKNNALSSFWFRFTDFLMLRARRCPRPVIQTHTAHTHKRKTVYAIKYWIRLVGLMSIRAFIWSRVNNNARAKWTSNMKNEIKIAYVTNRPRRRVWAQDPHSTLHTQRAKRKIPRFRGIIK